MGINEQKIHNRIKLSQLISEKLNTFKCVIHNEGVEYAIGNNLELKFNCCCDEFDKEIRKEFDEIIASNQHLLND